MAQLRRQRRHVLVAAPGQADQYPLARMLGGPAARTHQGVSALECRQNSFQLAALAQCRQRLLVIGALVAHAADRMQQRMLWPDSRIVESRRDRVSFLYLPALVLQQHRVAAVQNARPTVRQRRRVVTERGSAATGLDADELDATIRQKRMKQSDGIGAAAHAGDDGIGQAAVRSSICARASRPMTVCSSRTM